MVRGWPGMAPDVADTVYCGHGGPGSGDYLDKMAILARPRTILLSLSYLKRDGVVVG